MHLAWQFALFDCTHTDFVSSQFTLQHHLLRLKLIQIRITLNPSPRYLTGFLTHIEDEMVDQVIWNNVTVRKENRLLCIIHYALY
jgi:hypothetical protein